MLSALMQGTVAAVGDDAAAEFAAGYLWGTKQEDKRPYIMSCFATDTDLNNILDQIMTDYSRGDVESGDKRWSDAEPKFQKAIKPCDEVSGEFKDLSDYAKNISKKTIKARAEKYKAEINDLGAKMVNSWNSMVYFDAGMFDGQISAYMGLVPNPYPDMLEVESQRDPEAVPQFTAGWIYGISHQNEDFRDKLVQCYKSDPKLEDDYFEGMALYEEGKQKKGDKKFEDAGPRIFDAIADCDQEIIDSFTNWNAQLAALHEMKHWDKISNKIYKHHKDEIDADIALEFKWWDSAVYFNSGMYSGRFQKVFLDNAPEYIIGEMLSFI